MADDGYSHSNTYLDSRYLPSVASGSAVLVGGTIAVANTSVTASSVIRLTTLVPGGSVGHCYIASRTAGTGFTITSTSGTDTSTVYWEIVKF